MIMLITLKKTNTRINPAHVSTYYEAAGETHVIVGGRDYALTPDEAKAVTDYHARDMAAEIARAIRPEGQN